MEADLHHARLDSDALAPRQQPTVHDLGLCTSGPDSATPRSVSTGRGATPCVGQQETGTRTPRSAAVQADFRHDLSDLSLDAQHTHAFGVST
eukprot:3660730-Rhodomonas_salina.2